MIMSGEIVDLHTHTDCSDGVLTPVELLNRANEYGLAAVAITDHNTVAAYTAPTWEAAKRLGLELVPGIEISTADKEGRRYHVLGLLVDTGDPGLVALTQQVQADKLKLAYETVEYLRRDGWQIDGEVLEREGVISKSHIARAMIAGETNIDRLKTMFGDRLPTEGELVEATMIGKKIRGIPEYWSPQAAIEVIHGAMGVAILAHPSFNILMGERPEEMAPRFVGWGIDGFEAISVVYDRSRQDREVENRQYFTDFSCAHGLVITGGSDFHHDDASLIGTFVDLGFVNHPWEVSYGVLDDLRAYHGRKYTG